MAAEEKQLTLAEVLETDFLKCTICNKNFISPLLLPCLHAFCTECIAALPQKDVTNGNNIKMTQLQCPLCLATITMQKEMSPSPFLQSLSHLYICKHKSSPTCNYCSFDGKTEPAMFLCLDCKDDMCDICTASHRKTRLTRNHVVAPYVQIQNGLYDHDIRKCYTLQCPKHLMPYAHFCKDCVQLVCKTCQTENHKNHNLESSEAAATRLRPEATSFVEGLKKRTLALFEYQSFLLSQLSTLENKLECVKKSIKQQADAIHALVDKHHEAMLADINSAYTKEAQTIKTLCKDLSTGTKSLERNAVFLSHLLALGSAPEILQLHDTIMGRLKQLLHMEPKMMMQKLEPHFQPGPASMQNTSIMFGNLDLKHVPLGYEEGEPQAQLSISTLLPESLSPPQLVSSLNAKMEKDIKDVWPSGLSIYKDLMLVVDRDNKKIKIFDYTSTPPTVKFQFSGKAEHMLINPFDAVLMENGVVVVSDHGAEKVKMYDMTGQWIGDLSGEFRHPRGIAVTHSGKLVVIDGLLHRLTVHDRETGKVVHTIPATDDKGNKLLVDPFYVAVTDRDNIVVTDQAAPNLKLFSSEGRHLGSYGTYGTSSNEVLKPFGVCVDRYGQIFVADSNNHRVHLLLPNGKFSHFLLTHRDKVTHPVTLAISREGYLLVGEAFGQVKSFKYI